MSSYSERERQCKTLGGRDVIPPETFIFTGAVREQEDDQVTESKAGAQLSQW
jgi:hypothetical protein